MRFFSKNLLLPFALVTGLITGLFHLPFINIISSNISDIFINLLRLIAVPIVFLSITSTITKMENLKEMKHFGFKILKYTILTTIIAATIGLILFFILDPASQNLDVNDSIASVGSANYFEVLKKIIPSNLIEPFIENNVIGVALIAFVFSIATLMLPEKNKRTIHHFFSSLFAAFLKITSFIVKALPLAVWAFTTLLVKDLITNEFPIQKLGLYILCVVGANLIQGCIVLPIMLKIKKISPFRLLRAMSEPLTIAFFTKSSNAAMPVAMRCAQEKFNISNKVSQFSFPLCSVINMNACAAFILITVLFVSIQSGMHFSILEMLGWVLLASIAAIGNAGVPMGCFFLATAFLSSMGIPLKIMGFILPVYAFLDMLETAINVWSDSCITAVVDKDLKALSTTKIASSKPINNFEQASN